MKYIPRWIIFIILLFFLLTSGSVFAESDYLLQLDEPAGLFPQEKDWVSLGKADVSGDGKLEWVFYHDDTLAFYNLNRFGRLILWQEYAFDAPINAVELGDLDGDAVSEVIVAYDDIGIVDLIQWQDDHWEKSYSRIYLWSKVAHLDTLSLSNFPFKPILVITEDGTINLLRWNGIHPETQWENTALQGSELKYAGSGDLNGDGETDFALIVNDAELQVYSPADNELKPVWTNYPWGGISGCDIADLDKDSIPEIITVSPVGLIYAFEWSNTQFSQKWRYQDLPGIPRGLETISLPTSQRLALVSNLRGQIVIWPLNDSGFPLYRVELGGDFSDWALGKHFNQTGILGRTDQGKYLSLTEYPAQEVQVFFHQDDREFTELNEIVYQGRLWLPLRELAPLYDLSFHWNSLGDLLYLSKERVFMIFDPAEGMIWVNSLPYKTQEIKKIEGNFAVSLNLAEQIFNFRTHWLGQKAYLFSRQ